MVDNTKEHIKDAMKRRLAELGISGPRTPGDIIAIDKEGKEIKVGDLVKSSKWLVGEGTIVGYYLGDDLLAVLEEPKGHILRIPPRELVRTGTTA